MECRWRRSGKSRLGAAFAVLVLGCGGSEGRSVDHSVSALDETSVQRTQHVHSLHEDVQERINTLSHGIAQADFVGHVVVSRIEGQLGTTGRKGVPAIWSKVEFKVLHALKDHGVSTDARFALDFLGGRIGPKEMHVDHMPRFEEGDELILIARSDERPCPSFAGEYGVLRVQRGEVKTYFGHALRDINARGYVLATPRELAPSAPAPIPVGDASGRLVMPPVAEDGLNLDLASALARLSALVNAGA